MKLYRVQNKATKVGFYGDHKTSGFAIATHKAPQTMSSVSFKTKDLLRGDKYRFFFTSKEKFESTIKIVDTGLFYALNEIIVIDIDDELFETRLAIMLEDEQCMIHRTVISEYMA